MPAIPHWLREKRCQRQGPGFRSTLLRFDEPVDADFADHVADDLNAATPPGHRWLVNRESTHALRLTLVPAAAP